MIARSVRIPHLSLPRPSGSQLLIVAGSVIGGLAAAASVVAPRVDRPLFAALATLCLCLVALRRPQHAIVGVMVFLPFLGLARRILIPVAGWSGNDPLLLIAPMLSVLLVTRLFVRGTPLGGDLLSNLIVALLALTVLETAHSRRRRPPGRRHRPPVPRCAAPRQFTARQPFVRRLVVILLPVLMIVSLVIALYGLRQTSVGLLSWDSQWLQVSGYAALRVGNASRAFGTLASSAEYAAYLAAGLVLAAIWVMHGRVLPLLALPPLAIALFLDSSRGIVVIGFAAVLLVARLPHRGAAGSPWRSSRWASAGCSPPITRSARH